MAVADDILRHFLEADEILAYRQARGLPESQWRECAEQLVRTYTGSQFVDPEMLEWIMRKP